MGTKIDNIQETMLFAHLLQLNIVFKKIIIVTVITPCVCILCRMSQPIFIGKLLVYFDPDKSNTTSLSHAYIYASCLILNILIMIFMSHYCQVEMGHCGMKMRVACCSMIYKKVCSIFKQN